MAWRDAAADSGRLGSSDSPVRKRNLTVQPDFSPDTLSSQAAQRGYNKTDRPEGGPGPAMPVVGTRGEETD